MSDDVAELVERTRSGDAAAADRLVRLHLGAAHAVAFSVTRNTQDAEDVAQDAFVQALERLDECRDPARFAGWLIRIVRNRALNHRRYLGRRAAAPLDEAVTAVSGDDPLSDAGRAELRARLTRAVEVLTDTQREVLLLHDLEGWKHREIAEALGMPDGTVRYHLFQARRAVRGRLTMLSTGED
jgi:RNA polymerase sigma-70 factor, ECF subfamily